MPCGRNKTYTLSRIVDEQAEILTRAQAATLLDNRIAENVAAQKVDLIQWIFDGISVPPGSRVLELCSGTGAQTTRFIERVGQEGRVVALDVSQQALDTLMGKVPGEYRPRVTVVQSGMDELRSTLTAWGLEPPYFDLAFCAYGLYYSADVGNTLDEMKRWLRPGGRVAVVGPFGQNNAQLYGLLERGGVSIPAYVRYTTTDFMSAEVVPWAAQSFENVSISTVVNRISWSKPANVIEYWRNTSYFDAEKLPTMERLVDEHFANASEFVNEKWIMMLEASHART